MLTAFVSKSIVRFNEEAKRRGQTGLHACTGRCGDGRIGLSPICVANGGVRVQVALATATTSERLISRSAAVSLHAARRDSSKCNCVWLWNDHCEELAREGLVLNLIGVVVVSLYCYCVL